MTETTKKILIIIIAALCGIVFCISAYMLISYFSEKKQADDVYTQIIEESTVVAEQDKKPSNDSSFPEMNIDFDKINLEHSRSTSWIMIRNTVVNYPIVQADDNDYYLYRLPDGTKNKNGSIFMDYRNASDFSDRNTFIYGHHMKSGAMFASLTKYEDQSYYEEHPYIFIITPDEIFRCEIFSAYVIPDTSDAFTLSFKNDAEFDEYLQMVSGFSMISSAVEVDASTDRIITLSTCTYEYDNARFLVHAKLVSSEEEI